MAFASVADGVASNLDLRQIPCRVAQRPTREAVRRPRLSFVACSVGLHPAVLGSAHSAFSRCPKARHAQFLRVRSRTRAPALSFDPVRGSLVTSAVMEGDLAFESTESSTASSDSTRKPRVASAKGRGDSVRQRGAKDELDVEDDGFTVDDELDEDEEQDDEDADPPEDDEDDELFGYEIETDDEDDIAIARGRGSFDDDGLPIAPGTRRGSRATSRTDTLSLGGVDADEDDDIVDFEDSPGDVLDVTLSAASTEDLEDDAGDDFSPGGVTIPDIDDDVDGLDEDTAELFDEGSEEELRDAAKTLAESSLLGLGVDGAGRSDSSEIANFALGVDSVDPVSATPEPSPSRKSGKKLGRPPGPSAALRDLPDLVKRAEETAIQEDSDVDFAEDEFAEPQLEEDSIGGPKNLDAYIDVDEHDDEDMEFGVTTSTSFGRVWELNDDAYVTITEHGQAYAYDVDEGDSEDQDMATLRRGKAGGWGGGLQSDSRREAPKGSKEWTARRAYDLMKEAPKGSMFLWTRVRRGPPGDISKLFPKEAQAPPKFGPTLLEPPNLDAEEDVKSQGTELLDDDVSMRRGPEAGLSGDISAGASNPANEAIERAVDFPCMYKFKVVGSGEDFVESLTRDMEAVLGKKVPRSAFKFEDAGRLQRIIINVEVASAEQVTELYDAVRQHPGVKFSYG